MPHKLRPRQNELLERRVNIVEEDIRHEAINAGVNARWQRTEQEFVIAGYTPGERDYFGSLALGFYEAGKLHYAGNVGTGFNARNLVPLWSLLEPLKTAKNPFAKAEKIPRGTLWVKPDLVAQIKFANWTDDKKLRAPVFLGLRDDKRPREVLLPPSPA